MKYKLLIQEHVEIGGNGITLVNGKRSYFDPALSGQVLAHDLLEHPATPHYDGYIDELMALGAIMAGRMGRWSNGHWRCLDASDVVADLQRLTEGSLCEHGNFRVDLCRNRVSDQDIHQEMRSCLREGLLEAVSTYDDEDYKELPPKYAFDVDSMIGHMARGYQQFKRRFPRYSDFEYLFNEITRVSDRWLKGAELGDTAVLTVVHRTQTVYIEEAYDDPY